jgi:hypothetical protein
MRLVHLLQCTILLRGSIVVTPFTGIAVGCHRDDRFQLSLSTSSSSFTTLQESAQSALFEKRSVSSIGRRDDKSNKSKSNSTEQRPEVSPYYRRDRRDTAPITDTDRLQDVLAQRYAARQAHDYDRVTQLDQSLFHTWQIRVYEHPPIWTRVLEPPMAHMRRQARRKIQAVLDVYGPRGHAYQHVSRYSTLPNDWCRLTEPQVHTLLLRKTLAERHGQESLARAIAFELQVHGVRLHSSFLQWTTDPYHVFRNTTMPTAIDSKEFTTLAYTCQSPSLSDNLSYRRIQQLVQMRADAIVRGDEQEALYLHHELYQAYNVSVNDTACTYESRDPVHNETDFIVTLIRHLWEMQAHRPPLFPPLVFATLDDDAWNSPPYRCSQRSQALEPWWHTRVQTLILDRIHKREEGRFLEADAVRYTLWHTYRVGVNDRLHQYSVGGLYDDDIEPPV